MRERQQKQLMIMLAIIVALLIRTYLLVYIRL